jgi:hypothetical protein
LKEQREAVYAQLGGEPPNCQRLEVILNQLVCLACQFSRELANLERFTQPTADNGLAMSAVKHPAILKLSKMGLMKGGLQPMPIAEEEGKSTESGKSDAKHAQLVEDELKKQMLLRQAKLSEV